MIDETLAALSAEETNVPEQPEVPQEQPPVAEENTQKVISAKDKEDNLRILRERADRTARERDDYARRLQEYESRQKPESPEEDFSIKDDELVEGKHLSKAMKRIKQLEQQQRDYMQQSTESTAEIKLRSQYPDFDKVMTLENVQALSTAYPELANAINASADLYSKASSAYTLIKKFGIYEEKPFSTDKVRAEANAVKPRPLASVSPQQGDTPLSRANAFANGLTDDLKAQLRKEMEEARKLY